MAEGAGGSIYMDFLPRMDQSVLGSFLNDLTGRFNKASTDIGNSFGKGFGDATTAASQRMAQQLETNLQRAQRSVETAMSGMIKAQNDAVNSAGKVEVAQAKLNETLAKFEPTSAKALTAQNAFTRAQQGAAGAARNVEKATRDQIAAQTALSDASKAQQKHLEESSTASLAFGKAINVAGLAITGGFVAAVGIGIDKAADFQTTQTRLVTSAGEAATNLKLVSDGLLQMAGQVGFTAQQLSVGMYTIESAGYHGAAGLKVMAAAAQGAKMEGAELKTVADAVSTALTDYHLPATQAATVTSQLVTAVAQGKTTMEELSGSLHSITPLASAAGISLADVTGSLAEMTSHGMSADQASQNLADTLRHMLAPTREMRDALAQIRLTSGDVQSSLGSNGLSGTLDMLSQKVLSAEGPDGKMLLNAFNSSKDAAANLQEVVAKMPSDLQKLTQAFQSGTISSTDYRKQVGALPGDMKDLASGFLSAWDKANGFTNAIKNGSPQAQNYIQAIKALTGDATGLNTTLMLTGKNAGDTANNIKLISGATQDAGGNVKGWGDIQGTFNQQFAEFKASIGATAISLGTDFLPAATGVAKALADVGGWLSKNKGFTDALVIAVGAAAAAFAVWKTASAVWAVMNIGIEAASAAMGIFAVAEDGAAVSAGGLAAALAATGITEIVLGITALVAIIAGLVVGVKYAYDHWGWFHTAVQATWDALKKAGEWIAHTFMTVVHDVAHAWDNVVHAFGNVEHAVGNVEHVFGNIVHAVDNVTHALKVAGAIVLTVLAVPFVLAFKLIEAAVHWLYDNVIKPDFHAIGAIFHWLHDNVIQPVFHAIEAIFHWLYDNVVKPVVDMIKADIRGWGEVINWIHDHVIDPVFHVIGDIWHWLYDNVIHPIIEMIKTDIQGWGAIFQWLHDHVMKPVGDAIHTVMNGMKTAFKDVVDWLKEQWDRIEGIVGPPIKFIIDTVYNEGIVPTWNAIAGIFGLSKLEPVSGGLGASTPADLGTAPTNSGGTSPLAHAGGGVWQGAGVLPGYAPGRDSVNAILSPGEGVAVPELVNYIGPSRFMALNHAFSGGRKPGSGPGFDAGAVFGDIVGGAENIGNKLLGGAVNTAKFLAKLAVDPVGAVKDLFADVIGKTGGTPGGPSQWLDAAKAIPGKFIDSVIDTAKSWLSGHSGSGAPGVPFTGTPDLMGWISQAEQAAGVSDGWTAGLVTLIGRESGGNPNAQNNWDSNAAAGDPSRGLMQTIGSTFERYRDKSLPDNIFDPVPNIVAGINYIKARYGVTSDGSNLAARVQQADSSRPPQGYAGGGIAPGAAATPDQNDRTAIDRALGWARSLVRHPYNDQGWLDCSGLISGVFDQLENKAPARAFTTISDFGALGFKKGTGGIFDIGVNPKPGSAGHMVGKLDGHTIESGGSHNDIAVDGPATDISDPQFTDHWYLPGNLFVPAFLGAGATPSAANKQTDKLNTDVTKWQQAAQKAKDDGQKATDAATKHDQTAQKYLDDAAKADQLAATTSGTEKQKHVDAADHYRQLAQNAKDAGQRSRDQAAKYAQEAQDDQAKADAAQQDTAGTSAQPLTPESTTTGTSGTATSSGSAVQPMSLHDFGSRLGGIAADAFLETTGLPDPLQTPVFKIASALANAKWFQYQDQPQQKKPAQAQPIPPQSGTDDTDQQNVQVFDDGGWLEPNKLAINLGKRPEPILAPRERDNLDAIAKGGANGAMKYMVHIENMHVTDGDGRQVGRDIYREMLAYQAGGGR